MRKIYTAILLIMTAVSFTAFGNQKVDGKKILIAYFSVPENEKNNGLEGSSGLDQWPGCQGKPCFHFWNPAWIC